MQDYRFDLELQIIRFHEINSNSNTCHCTAQVTPSMLGNLHVWVLQSWGELVRWLCVLAERGYTTWPPVHYFAFFSKFQVSDFRANEVQFTTSLYNLLLQSGSPEFAVDWKELHNRAENEPSLSLKFPNHFAFNQEKVLVWVFSVIVKLSTSRRYVSSSITQRGGEGGLPCAWSTTRTRMSPQWPGSRAASPPRTDTLATRWQQHWLWSAGTKLRTGALQYKVVLFQIVQDQDVPTVHCLATPQLSCQQHM